MKKILLLGGSEQQVVAIETAKRLGYYTVLCDYLPDNPGQYSADKFYLISTTDKTEILKVAMEEQIAGILAYASDPAAPTAAYVAEQLRLPGNPYNSVETLCNKDKFRKFLKENGFNAPKAEGYSSRETVIANINRFELPIIIKPVDSSGSKGVTVLDSIEGLEEAVQFAFDFSRSHKIIIEEFIEKKHRYLIGGDIFVIDGKIVLWGLMNCHRDEKANSLVPVGKSFPANLLPKDLEKVKFTLQELVTKLQIKNGAMNVELVIDQKDRVWPIDIGPRSGGNMIPDLLGHIFDVDLVEMSIKAAMGEAITTDIRKITPYFASYNLHSLENGSFENVEFSSKIEPYIIKKHIYKVPGDPVEFFDNASKALGIVFFKFDTEEQMLNILDNMSSYIKIKLR